MDMDTLPQICPGEYSTNRNGPMTGAVGVSSSKVSQCGLAAWVWYLGHPFQNRRDSLANDTELWRPYC